LRPCLCFALVFASFACAAPPLEPDPESPPPAPPARALPAPSAVLADERSFELARVWVTEGGVQVSLRVDPRQDPGAWGEILGEVALHIANAYVQRDGRDRLETLDRMLVGLDRHLRFSSDGLEGEFVEPPSPMP